MKTYPDMEAARELEIYADNTRAVYDRWAMPTVENLRKKYKKGTYDKEKAVKAWEYVAEAAAKMYCHEFADRTAWHIVFNAATRRIVAEGMEAYYYAEYISAEG